MAIKRSWVSLLLLCAGALDFCTGLGLVTAPDLTLRLMLAAPVGPEAEVFLRWVGAFVAAVGASYLLAWRKGTDEAFRGVLSATIPFRLAAGLYSAWALGTGRLSPQWASVPATDLALVALQSWLLRKGWQKGALDD